MRISQLRYFVTVAQLENMSQAAQLLHLSQSSLSKNISTLEEELGMPLFQRNGRKLILNPAGTRLLEYSNMVLRELQYTIEDMRLLSENTESRIRIGTAGYNEKLVGCLSEFRKIMPQADFEITGNIESLERLDINEFDMLIYPEGHKYEKLTGMPLYQESYSLCVPSSHPLAKNEFIRAKMLEGTAMVFLRKSRNSEEYPFQICNALALRFSSVSYADTRDLQKQMVSDGLGLCFVPDSCTSVYQSEKTRLIPIMDKRFSRKMMICFRREKYLSPLAKQFKDFVLAYFALTDKKDV